MGRVLPVSMCVHQISTLQWSRPLSCLTVGVCMSRMTDLSISLCFRPLQPTLPSAVACILHCVLHYSLDPELMEAA